MVLFTVQRIYWIKTQKQWWVPQQKINCVNIGPCVLEHNLKEANFLPYCLLKFSFGRTTFNEPLGYWVTQLIPDVFQEDLSVEREQAAPLDHFIISWVICRYEHPINDVVQVVLACPCTVTKVYGSSVQEKHNCPYSNTTSIHHQPNIYNFLWAVYALEELKTKWTLSSMVQDCSQGTWQWR